MAKQTETQAPAKDSVIAVKLTKGFADTPLHNQAVNVREYGSVAELISSGRFSDEKALVALVNSTLRSRVKQSVKSSLDAAVKDSKDFTVADAQKIADDYKISGVRGRRGDPNSESAVKAREKLAKDITPMLGSFTADSLRNLANAGKLDAAWVAQQIADGKTLG